LDDSPGGKPEGYANDGTKLAATTNGESGDTGKAE
jgi:hypothetical protein